MTSMSLRHSLKQMKWTVQNLYTSFLQTVPLWVRKHQTTSLLMCRDFPMVSMRSKRHASRPIRFSVAVGSWADFAKQ